MLSLHTNRTVLSAQNALRREGMALAVAQSRLGTGLRVNSAQDDASGLQMAMRLKAQSSGMAVAMRNTQNSVSMLQAADGLLGAMSAMLMRIQDLAVQAADGASTDADRVALHAEYVQLSKEVRQTLNETPYNGKPLIRYTVPAPGVADPGTLGEGPLSFQTGADAAETVTVDFRPALGALNVSLYYAIDDGRLSGQPPDGPGTELSTATAANALIGRIGQALDDLGDVRAQVGATGNRLESVYRNLSTMRDNTRAAQGRIMDADYAGETAAMTASQMLMQSGTAMLRQANQGAQLALSLLQ